MKWVAVIRSPRAGRFTIEPEEYFDGAGNMTIRYKIIVILDDGFVDDYQQDSLEVAKGSMLEDFFVPLNAWQVIDG